jgi:hypothetical protein
MDTVARQKTPLPEGEGWAQAKPGRVRGSAARRVILKRRNPSSSHAFGAGPSFSLWEKVRGRAL